MAGGIRVNTARAASLCFLIGGLAIIRLRETPRPKFSHWLPKSICFELAFQGALISMHADGRIVTARKRVLPQCVKSNDVMAFVKGAKAL